MLNQVRGIPNIAVIFFDSFRADYALLEQASNRLASISPF